MDAAGVDGDRLSSGRGVRGAGDQDEPVYIVADKLAAVTARELRVRGRERDRPLPGREARARHVPASVPAVGRRQILGVLADYVTMDQGTGAVHTAPSHGADDFYTGVKYKLSQDCNVDDGGTSANGLPEYDGETVFKANPKIVELLKSRGVLMHLEKIEHSYPHCWRCHNPVIFRATEQWFIAMEAQARRHRTAAPAFARRDQASEMGSSMGRGAHRQHDRDASRLVHLAAARLGRAHRGVLLRKRSCNDH